MDNRLSKKQAAAMIIKHNDGTIFTVTFRKRTDGLLRVMNCRKGVKKNVTGRGLPFDPAKKGLVSVFDMQINDFRMISLESIHRLAIKGVEYLVE